MRRVAMFVALAAILSLLLGCGGGSSVDPLSGEQALTSIKASTTEINALSRAIEDAQVARRIYLNPDNPSDTRIKAMHITLLLAGMGNKGFNLLVADVKSVVLELEQIAETPGDPSVRTAALDLVAVGRAMISPSTGNPALFVGYPGHLPYTPWEGLVPVPEQMLSEKLAPDECFIVVQKIEGLKVDRFQVKDPNGKIVYNCLWIPIEIIKALKWCRKGTEPPAWIPDSPEFPVVQIIKVPQLMTMVELFVKLVGSGGSALN